jgi:hypothetical protein
MAVELYGYQFSVYSWIARLALEEKGVDYHWIEVDPFGLRVPAIWRCTPSNVCQHSFTTAFSSTRPGRSHATSTRLSLAPVSNPQMCAIALAATSSSLSSTATPTGHWCDKYFHIVSFAHASGDLRMTQRYDGVWRQRPRCLPPWSGLLLTPSISAVPNYRWQTSTLHR